MTFNPHGEAYAEIEEVDRQIKSINHRLEFLDRYADEHNALLKQRTAAHKPLEKLEAEHASA